MKLAIVGTRGVPPEYGGFETFAAELGKRLVLRGHDVTVYSRAGRVDGGEAGESWEGIRRVVLPAIGHKYFETVSHTFLSALHAIGEGYEAVLVCNAANAFILPLLRAARIPAAINVDGIERRRKKWNAAGRAVYAIGESFSVAFASEVIADAGVIARYYRERFGAEPLTIPYGAEFPPEEDSDVLERLKLRARDYVLYVSRFEPENNPLGVVQAYERLLENRQGSVPPLVMVGQGLYAPDLVAELRRHASDSILFPGALYGPDYRTLQRNALVYVQATEVGGTHPALIEAMASGGCVVALDTPENREVGGDSVGYFRLGDGETLSETLRRLLGDPGACENLRRLARRRAGGKYAWDVVTDGYEELFQRLSGWLKH